LDFSVFDKLLDSVLVVDEKKAIVYCNEAFATMIGVSIKRLKPGKMGHEFLTFEDPSVFLMPEGNWGKDSATLYKEFAFETKKGNKGEASIAVIPVKVADQSCWVHYMRDMTLEIQLQKKYRAELEQKEGVIDDLKDAQAELQKYSKNLEQMVEARTEELRKANKFVQTMIDSLGQGLLVFNKENECMPTFTKACVELFPGQPEQGKKIWDIMELGEDKARSFKKWSDSVFSEILPFEDLSGLGPANVDGEDDQYIALEYHPFREDDGSLAGVVTVATDKTKEHQATKEAEKQQEYANMVIKLVKNKNQFLSFVKDSRKMIDHLVHVTSEGNEDELDFNEILLLMHSIKGGAGVYSITKIFEMAHDYETGLEPYKERDPSEFLEYLPTFHQQILNIKKTLENYFKDYRYFLGDAIVDGFARVEIKLKDLHDFGDRLTSGEDGFLLKQKFEEQFVKQPAYSLLGNYSDRVIEIAENNGKKMNPITFHGKNVRINTEYYSELFTNLVHAFSNAVIHGLENPDDRKMNGKQETGQMNVNFYPYFSQGKKWMKISIEDDGRGIDPSIIRKKLIEKGLSEEEVESESELEIIQHIFDDSFSTAEAVSNIAGRGVGMNAIKASVLNMGGELVMESVKGQGCKLIIDVPDC
jgi:two-component system chemotaxis sensor kinase CheA